MCSLGELSRPNRPVAAVIHERAQGVVAEPALEYWCSFSLWTLIRMASRSMPSGFFALTPAAEEWPPAKSQIRSRAAWRAREIAVITAGASSVRVVGMREIAGDEATSPNRPGSHRDCQHLSDVDPRTGVEEQGGEGHLKGAPSAGST